MSLRLIPEAGMVLICNFEDFEAPEMTKVRPVVVISPRSSSFVRFEDYTGTVVPLSTTAPRSTDSFHHRMDPNSLPQRYAKNVNWAKCNMLYTVSLARLDRVNDEERPDKRPNYVVVSVTDEDLKAILWCVQQALGVS